MSDLGPVEDLLERYRAAVYAKDVDAFAALYDEEVRVFEMWGQWAYQGTDDWRGMVAEWFGSLGEEKVGVEFDDLRTTVGDDIATGSAYVTFKGLSADDEVLRAMNNRLTWVLHRTPDGWKVIHEHTSAPVEFDTGKVTLHR